MSSPIEQQPTADTPSPVAGERRYLSEASMAALNGTNVTVLPTLSEGSAVNVTDGVSAINTGAAMTA